MYRGIHENMYFHWYICMCWYLCLSTSKWPERPGDVHEFHLSPPLHISIPQILDLTLHLLKNCLTKIPGNKERKAQKGLMAESLQTAVDLSSSFSSLYYYICKP